jgi:hypothetical protein
MFVGRTPADELAVFKIEDLAAVRCKRHGLSLNTLMVETPSGKRFVFRTKKIACKQIEARSRMRGDRQRSSEVAVALKNGGARLADPAYRIRVDMGGVR